jgi:hypothetical protein
MEDIRSTQLAKIALIPMRVSQFYGFLCHRELCRCHSEDDDRRKRRKAQLMYAKHLRDDRKPKSRNDYVENSLGGKKSFFGDALHFGSSPLESPGLG